MDRLGLENHIRPYLNGRDLTGRSRRKLVIDLFGLTADEVRARFPEIYQHVTLTVKTERDVNKRDYRRANWWLFGENNPRFRQALAGLRRYIATAETSKHRTFSFIDGSVLPDNKLVAIAIADAAALAILSSRVHVDWSLRAGGWLGVGNDPVYIKSRCFDPFPFPAWSRAQHAALADAGERLDAFRKARLSELGDLTLTRLYNALEAHRAGKSPDGEGERRMSAEQAGDFQRASVLVLAELHNEIDALTLDAYGWPRDLAEADVLARLVALNAERRAEEVRGEVRWLRPDYQRPRFAKVRVAGPAAFGDLITDVAPAPADQLRWPGETRLQVLYIKGALADAPLDPRALASRFKGRKAAADVPRLLGVLQNDGQVRRGPDGRYALLRAA